jgi:hypothetical protein
MLIFGLRPAISILLILVGISATPSTVPSDDDSSSANELLRMVVENELRIQAGDHSHWKYESRSQTSGRDYRREVIQTRDGEIDGVLEIDGRPLTQSEERNESERIQHLANNPDRQRKRQRDQAQDAQKSERMLKVLPEVVVASYGERKGELLELNFKPNPNFRPSSHEQQVFHAMSGRVWVDTKENRLAEIEGRLTRTVKFGGGLLGHLDKGGEFHVKQSEVAPGHWEITLMHVEMRGKALLFKTIGAHQDESRSDFQRIPDDLSLAQGAAELRQQLHVTTRRQR